MGKSFARSLDEARFTFFSPDLPKGDLIRYQQQLAACSPVRLLDLSALNKASPWGGWCIQLGRAAEQRLAVLLQLVVLLLPTTLLRGTALSQPQTSALPSRHAGAAAAHAACRRHTGAGVCWRRHHRHCCGLAGGAGDGGLVWRAARAVAGHGARLHAGHPLGGGGGQPAQLAGQAVKPCLHRILHCRYLIT